MAYGTHEPCVRCKSDSGLNNTAAVKSSVLLQGKHLFAITRANSPDKMYRTT